MRKNNFLKITTYAAVFGLIGGMSFEVASQQNAQQNQNSCDIIGKAEFRRAYHRLKRPDGTGAGGCRTGIAVESRHTDGLPRALVQPALKKIWQMQIGQ